MVTGQLFQIMLHAPPNSLSSLFTLVLNIFEAFKVSTLFPLSLLAHSNSFHCSTVGRSIAKIYLVLLKNTRLVYDVMFGVASRKIVSQTA